MDERTDEELIRSLRRHRADSDIDEIVRRLRTRDEGERIEGWARDRGFPHDKRTVWSFSRDKHGTTDETPATLITHAPEATEQPEEVQDHE